MSTQDDIARVTKWQFTGLMRSCLLQLTAIFSMACCLLITVGLAYLLPFPRAWDDWRFIIGFISGVVCNLILWLVVANVVIFLRKRKLNTLFGQLQGTVQSYFFGQHYQAEIQVSNFPVHILLQKGPMLTLTIPLVTQVRATIQNKHSKPLTTLAELATNSSDPQWLQDWMHLDQQPEQIMRVLTLGSSNEIRTVMITPEALLLRLYRFPLNQFTPETMRQLVEDFVAIAKAAQMIPHTQHPVETNALERMNSAMTRRAGKIMFWTILGTFGAVFLIAGTILLVLWMAGQLN